MKILSKVLEGIGVVALFVGGGAMDNAPMIVPFVIAVAGVGIAYLGAQIEEVYT